MRIVHVLQIATATPIVALERDGALYDVAELEHHFKTKLLQTSGTSDFHTRVVALRCAGLHALNDRLLSGERPTTARLLPGDFIWLPPCVVDRAAYVQLGPYDHGLDRPSYRLGNARGLVGHDVVVPFPAAEEEPDFELNIAAVLFEDLRRATPDEAARAIAGYAVLNDWTARGAESRARARGVPPSEARDFATQLGPALVTPDEVGPVEALRTQVRVKDEARRCSRVGEWPYSLAESIAFVSNHVELHAGDVIGAGRVLGGSAACAGRKLGYGDTVDLMIERIGRLTGKPMPGPALTEWRYR